MNTQPHDLQRHREAVVRALHLGIVIVRHDDKFVGTFYRASKFGLSHDFPTIDAVENWLDLLVTDSSRRPSPCT
jgi:hypothetical protein